MNDSSFLTALYSALLKRDPKEKEFLHWLGRMERGMTDRELFARFIASKEYAEKTRVRCAYPPGHYYSPIVDPESLDSLSLSERHLSPMLLPGIEICPEKMLGFWKRNADLIAKSDFPLDATPGFRYFAANKIYPVGDAVLLRAMMLDRRPKRYIEIGSGFSSACALDAADEAGLETEFVFIEPYTDRLRSILWPKDAGRVRIIETFVQNVPLALFATLGEDDILLIDSTHVMKTGSDVHYELFKILPSLKPGVCIHFHDIHYPFEYPNEWIFDSNLSWNEIYAIRAFLMHNHDYAIEFFTNYFALAFPDVIRSTYPRFLQNGGGSLWLKKLGPSAPV
jgi:Methyltransferase domain/Domain of unknown function (DUF4214)